MIARSRSGRKTARGSFPEDGLVASSGGDDVLPARSLARRGCRVDPLPRCIWRPGILASEYFGVRVFWCPSILATDVASCRSVPGEDPPMKRFWPLFALVWLAAALPASAGSVPDALTPWVDWVLRDRPDHGCYRLAAEPERRHCMWPGTLEIELTAQGASF